MKKQNGFSLVGVLLIIGALVITTGGVLVWQRKTLPTPITILMPPPVLEFTPPGTTQLSQALSFSQLWQRQDELVGQQVLVRATVNLLVACPQYEGCCKPEECAATVILGENLGTSYVSIFLHEAGERITCRWQKENSNDCQGWKKDGEYLITGVLGQEGYSFYLEVLSKQKT